MNRFRKSMPELLLVIGVIPLFLPLFFASYTIDLLAVISVVVATIVSLYQKITHYRKDRSLYPLKFGYYLNLILVGFLVWMVFTRLSVHQKIWRVELRHNFQSDRAIRNQRDLDSSMMYFYSNQTEKNFREIESAVFAYQKDLGEQHEMLLALFIGTIVKKNNWDLHYRGDVFSTAQDIADGTNPILEMLANDSIIHPGKLDSWWGQFFATGDTTYLGKIYNFIGTSEKSDDPSSLVVARAAEWSFGSNYQRHEVIREYVDSAIIMEIEESKIEYLQKLLKKDNDE